MVNLAEQFYAGRYSEIVGSHIDSPTPYKLSPTNAVYVVGSLSFLARTSEADTIFDVHSYQMSPRESLEARFYLALAHRRLRRQKSNATARKILISMAKDLRNIDTPSDLEKFFFCCGVAFYRYTDARLYLALGWARKAYDHAFRAQFVFGRLVSYDLMGHCQMNIGDVHAGIKNLTSSANLSESIGRGATKQAAEVGLRLYRSTFGLKHAQVLLDDLQGAIRACSFENSFSMANLLIEQSRLQLLAGKGDLAEQSLKEAGEWVYRLDLPFFDANLSFRYAHLYYLQGDYKKAFELLHAASERATESNDASMEVRILGLKSKILKVLEKAEEANSLSPQLRQLEKKSGLIIARRIHARNGISSQLTVKRGEDLLGDLLDDITDDCLMSREKLIQSGFLGLLPKIANVSLFSQAILFGFIKDSVTIIAKGQVRHDADGWPDLVNKLFSALSSKRELSKEEMTQKIWNQTYNPTRHDPLIYALIARARKILEPHEHWLKIVDGKYQIDSDILIQDVSISTTLESSERKMTVDSVSKYPDLPIRQIKILKLCEKLGSVTNKDICDEFDVSEVTASRDLTELTAKNYLRRVGKGRATSYVLV